MNTYRIFPRGQTSGKSERNVFLPCFNHLIRDE
jgi:hypothetical protein